MPLPWWGSRVRSLTFLLPWLCSARWPIPYSQADQRHVQRIPPAPLSATVRSHTLDGVAHTELLRASLSRLSEPYAAAIFGRQVPFWQATCAVWRGIRLVRPCFRIHRHPSEASR